MVGRDAGARVSRGGSGRARRGGAACVTLEGEPGIGKTRLLDELRARAEQRGHVVLDGAAAEFERELPFSVWVDALDAYVVSQDLDEHRALERRAGGGARPGAALAAVGERRPGRRRRRALPRAPRRQPAARRWSPRSSPLVLVLDDLHWSDGASIELIAALVRARAVGARAAGARLPPGAGVGAARRGARAGERAQDRAVTPERGRGGAAARRRRRDLGRRHLPPRRRQPVLSGAARPLWRGGPPGRCARRRAGRTTRSACPPQSPAR